MKRMKSRRKQNVSSQLGLIIKKHAPLKIVTMALTAIVPDLYITMFVMITLERKFLLNGSYNGELHAYMKQNFNN